MYTQCPECLSVFSLDARALAQAHGEVVCGHCGERFDSIITLTTQLPPEPFSELPINSDVFQPPQLDQVVYRPTAALPPPSPIASTAAADIDDASDPVVQEDFSQLSFAPRNISKKNARALRRSARPRSDGTRHWPWAMAGLVLLLLLGAQLGWAKRDWLISNPVTGSWLRSGCHAVGCRLPLVAAPEQLRLLASNVQSHPGVSGALMISASIRNDAAFAQPYPVIAVTLSDAQGQRIAMRRLQPREYLDDDSVLQRGLPAGGSAALLLEVEDPGDKAVAFEFGFE